jgi:hypothetical protein
LSANHHDSADLHRTEDEIAVKRSRQGGVNRTQRAGVPVDVDQWQWSCGFYPGLRPGQHRYGTAASFEEARLVEFEADWKALLPEIPESAFEKWRHQRDFTKEKYASWARGEKLPSEIASSMVRCVCGVRFDSWKSEESYDHRLHIYAAQAAVRRV